jgi:hypothetical protein
MRSSALVKWAALISGFAVLFSVFLLGVRPFYLRWGARIDDVKRVLPGDAIVPSAVHQETRAIAIRAPVGRVWPWLAQIGQDRGGFYSYTILENLIGCQMPDAERIHPEMQQWRLGDKLWMYPPEGAGGVGHADLFAYQPGRALAFGTWLTPPRRGQTKPPEGSWAFVLEPTGDQTRFLVRGRTVGGEGVLERVYQVLLFQPAHFVMERKMMVGLKRRAEGGESTPISNAVEVACWTIVFAFFVAAIVLVFRSTSLTHSLAAMIAAGLAFQALTFLQPGPVVAVLVVAALWLSFPWRGRSSRRNPTLLNRRLRTSF